MQAAVAGHHAGSGVSGACGGVEQRLAGRPNRVRGRKVLIIDHASKLAEKIRISGGGRCNFTNLDVKPSNYVSQNPHFCRSALARLPPTIFPGAGLQTRHCLSRKTLGQLFCDDSAQQIIDMLQQECRDGGVQWAMPCKVNAIGYDGVYWLDTSNGPFSADSLVIATGPVDSRRSAPPALVMKSPNNSASTSRRWRRRWCR